MEELPAVGERIVVDLTEAATVRYVGPVAGTEGSWVGVEFDKVGRGKHDGSHNGARYFTCTVEGSSNASFVRPAKIKRGCTLLSALHDKYQQARYGGPALAACIRNRPCYSCLKLPQPVVNPAEHFTAVAALVSPNSPSAVPP